MGTQLIQVIGRKFSSIPVDDIELVGNFARSGRDLALDGAKVCSTRDTLLESDDVLVGGSIRNLRNSEKGGWHSKDGEEESGKSEELLRKHAEGLCRPGRTRSGKGVELRTGKGERTGLSDFKLILSHIYRVFGRIATLGVFGVEIR